MRVTELFWCRIPYGGLLGIRLSPWWFLAMVEFACGPRESVNIQVDFPPDEGNWRLRAIGIPRVMCLPTRATRAEAIAFRDGVTT